jgi:hypothetical protein
MRRLPLLVCGLAGLVSLGVGSPVSADAPDGGALRASGSPPDDADPLADTDLDALAEVEARARRERAARGPTPPDLPVREGEVLTAPSGVREIAHGIDAVFEDGLLVVTHTVDLVSTARLPVELQERIAVPAGTWLAGLTVCDGARCREGLAAGAVGEAAYEDAVRARPAEDALPFAPVAHARRVRDARGEAIVVRAAPLRPDGPLRLTLRWIASAPLVGGTVRAVIPARGQDPRVAAARLTVRAPGMIGATADGLPTSEVPATIEPWFPVELAASLPRGAPLTVSVVRTRCGSRDCTRVRAAAGTREGAAVSLVLLIDASPSMLGPARGRLEPALAAILAAAPRGTTVRALAFGARAEAVVERPLPADVVPLAALLESAQYELGPSTRLDVAAAAIAPWLEVRDASRPVHLVIVGDGGLTESPESRAALAALGARGVRVSVVDLDARAPTPALATLAGASGGVVVQAGAGEPGAARLEEQLGALFAPLVADGLVVQAGEVRVRLPPLRAGEERVWQAAHPAGRATLAFVARRLRDDGMQVFGIICESVRRVVRARGATGALAVGLTLGVGAPEEGASIAAVALPDAAVASSEALACAAHGPARHASGVSSDASPVALVGPRACAIDAAERQPEREPGALPTGPAPNPLAGRGLPAETLHAMLRMRVVPAARACFQADRAGRADHSVRVSISFALADRELAAADIGGAITPVLRACLFEALERIEVPRFEGTVIVRYPVYTEAVPPPPTIELGDGAARGVDGVFGDAVHVDDVRRLPLR